ncbi:MAG: hypothetical protein KAT58_07885 [candidate division Zixibacteria bacterium]|nr:hypothetical protein [candidate division Zixibacteria bacterium]
MPGVHDILQLLKQDVPRIDVGGVFGSARAYILARMVEDTPDRTRLVICPTEDAATTLLQDIELFLPEALHHRVRAFPEADTLPYLKLSPDPVRWADRMERLYELNAGHAITIITTIAGASRVTPPTSFIAHGSREVRMGAHLDRDEFATWLVEHGYVDVGLVEDEGSFALRGGIVDVWTPTLDDLVRIELDGDEIVSMRRFDPANQRSRGELRSAHIIPAGDVCFTPEATERALGRIRKRADDKGLPGPDKRLILERVRERITFEGIETFAPFFHDERATIIDYLPQDALVIIDDPDDVREQLRAHFEKLHDLAATSTSLETLVSPDELYTTADDVLAAASKCTTMTWQATETPERLLRGGTQSEGQVTPARCSREGAPGDTFEESRQTTCESARRNLFFCWILDTAMRVSCIDIFVFLSKRPF